MLRLRLSTDYQPVPKNGQPPHSTTSVASSSSPFDTRQKPVHWGKAACRPIATTTSGDGQQDADPSLP